MDTFGCSLQQLLQEHIVRMSIPVEKYSTEETPFNAPFIPSYMLGQILDYATNIIAEDPIVLNIKGPIFIIGDLHGHLFDLYRIFQRQGLPPDTNYLFLGDFVDRGVYSTEVVTLVIILKILYPKNIFLIRGNHEFIPTKQESAFKEELMQLYINYQDILNKFYQFFSFIPLAAQVGDYLCVHGGLCPKLKTIDQIEQIRRPIQFSSDIVEGITWSDPKPDQKIAFMNSPRGHGFYFNETALNEFLVENKLKGIIRGHLFIDGIASMFDGRCITVFSASNYTPTFNNSCGILLIDANNQLSSTLYPPLNTPPRKKPQSPNPVSRSNNSANNSILIPRMMHCKRLTKIHGNYTCRPKTNSILPQLDL